MKKKVLKRLAGLVAWLVGLPIGLFLLLATLLYIPPIQQFLVNRVAAGLSESLGMRITVERVRLAFPLDLVAERVLATEQQDTLLAVRSLRFSIPVRPLLEGRADVDGFRLFEAKVNSKELLPDTYVRGTVGELTASLHGVEWRRERIVLDEAHLSHAHLMVALSDTAAVDTTPSTGKWLIRARELEIEHSDVQLSLPGDSMRLRLAMQRAELVEGHFDTGRNYYAFQRFLLKEGAIRYATRPLGQLPPRGNAAYTKQGPLPWDTLKTAGGPINPALIDATHITLRIDTLSYDASGTLRLHLAGLTLREQCGLYIREMRAGVYLDSLRLHLANAHLLTPHTRIDAQVDLPFKALESRSEGLANAEINARVGKEDIRCLARGFVDPAWVRLLPEADLTLQTSLAANMHLVELRKLEASWPGILAVEAYGSVQEPMDESRSGQLVYDVRVDRFAPLRGFLPKDVAAMVDVPRSTNLRGKVNFNGDDIRLQTLATALRGQLQLRAQVGLRSEQYAVDLESKGFPIGSFLPTMGLGPLTAQIQADGRGFDPLQKSARLQADANVRALRYTDWQLGGIDLQARMAGGALEASLNAANDIVRGKTTLTASLGPQIRLQMDGSFEQIDLQRLGGLKDTLLLGADLHVDAYTDKALTDYGVRAGLEHIFFLTKDRGIPAKDILLDFATNRDTTTLLASAGDLYIDMAAQGNLDKLMNAANRLSETLTAQINRKSIDTEELKAHLPVVQLNMNVGKGNPVSNLMKYMGYTFGTLHADIATDPTMGLNGILRVGALRNQSLLLDTIDVVVRQDTTGLVVDGRVKNYSKRNPTKFEALLNGYVTREDASVGFKFLDNEGDTGVDVGVKAELLPNGVGFQLFPERPILAYRNFRINGDNYLYLGRDRTITADIDLVADDGTALSLYSQPDSTANDITLSMQHVNLGELSNVMPYLPQLSGKLGGDIHLIDDHESLKAMASIQAQGLTYEGAELGNIGLEAIYLPKEGGEHHFDAFVSSDEAEVMSLGGIYYDRDEGYFDGNAELLDFPLRMLNGFLAGTDMAMDGRALGSLTVKGPLSKPKLGGELSFDSAHFFSPVYGFNFNLDPQPVRIDEGKMQLEDFRLTSSQSKNPLLINGTLNMADLSNISMNFNMKARNFELINAKRSQQSLVYGKVYADFQGQVRGNLNQMIVRGSLDVLDRTNMTYILKDSPLTVEDRLSDLVQFVDFTDTIPQEEEIVMPSTIDLTLGISVSDAARFHCNLSEDGNNYVDLEGGGNLTMRMTEQGDLRLTGRFTMEQGEMKYSLPIIPLKTFKIQQGSYVEFTGDILNPTLNLAATERVKATVTENDQPRSVAFDVGVDISGSLEKMGLEFTIEAPEDLAMQNKLTSMTIDQRGKSAVAMLATGMFLDDESLTSGGNGFKASNALTAFLQSEIQNIAGNALKSIDLSIGMENGTSSTGSTTTDYSFQFAKRFYNNRISVIVGGKVSTGADATNSAESFIDNVTVEYRLDKSATRYVRAFYDRGTQDPFEGQLMKTGAGLVLRRKTDRLGELFIFRTNRKKH